MFLAASPLTLSLTHFLLLRSWPNENGERNALIMREEEESSTMGEGEDSTASRHLPYRDRSVRHSRPPSSVCVEASSGSSISTWAWNLPRLKIFFKTKFYFNGVQTLTYLKNFKWTFSKCRIMHRRAHLPSLSVCASSLLRPPARVEMGGGEGKGGLGQLGGRGRRKRREGNGPWEEEEEEEGRQK